MASINFSDGFQLEEKLWANENGFHEQENPFPPAQMNYFIEKYISTRRKATGRIAGESVFPTINKLPFTGIFFKKSILSNFNNGLH